MNAKELIRQLESFSELEKKEVFVAITINEMILHLPIKMVLQSLESKSDSTTNNWILLLKTSNNYK